MSGRDCDAVAEWLVDCADGALTSGESAVVAGHLAACERCRAKVAALRKSLALAKVIWEDAAAGLMKAGAPGRYSRKHLRLWLRTVVLTGVAAAGIALAVVGVRFWRSPPAPAVVPDVPVKAASASEVAREIARIGMSAELLRAADLLADEPAARSAACERYRYIASTYAETPAGTESEGRYRTLCEQRNGP